MLGAAAAVGDTRQVAAVGNLHLLLWLVGRRVALMQGMRKGVGLQGRRRAQAGRGAAKQHRLMTVTEMLLWMRTKSSRRRRRSRSSSLLSGAKELLRVLQLARRQQQRAQKPLQLRAVVADQPGRRGVDPCIVLAAAFD
jgi:hypothetical protein